MGVPTSGPRRVAIVTGCGKRNGIGAGIARRLADDGVAVVVTDVVRTGVPNEPHVPEDLDPSWDGLRGLTEEIARSGGQAVAAEGDISREDDVERLVGAAIASYGRLDILVNNAGAPQGADYAYIEDMPVAAFDLLMNVNVRGTFLMCRSALPHMRKGGWGRIVNMSSIVAKVGRPKVTAYSTSKAAILGMTRSIAIDVARFGITANAICPGSISTSRNVSSSRREGAEDIAAHLAKRMGNIPVGRWGQPTDIAAMTSFLVSEQASFITGQAFNVDGGTLPI